MNATSDGFRLPYESMSRKEAHTWMNDPRRWRRVVVEFEISRVCGHDDASIVFDDFTAMPRCSECNYPATAVRGVVRSNAPW